MYKEIIITIFILSIVLIGNVLTQNNTAKAVDIVSSKLQNIQTEITKTNKEGEEGSKKERIEKVLNETEKTWQEEYEKMAYYIEHTELEKVQTELSRLKANIQTKQYDTAIENIAACSFVLKHIQDKSALKIVNIF